MAYKTVTLTENNQWIAVRGTHKTNVITLNINGTFANGASLIETTTLTGVDGEPATSRAVPFRDSSGSQVVITNKTQYSRSVSDNERWYILTVQNATGTTNIEFDYSGIEVKTNV